MVWKNETKRKWRLKKNAFFLIQFEFSSSDKQIEEKVKKIMDSENVYKIYLNAKQLWILKKTVPTIFWSMLKKERPMLKKRTNDAGAMAKNDNVIEERVKKIMDSETINWKLVSEG